MKRFIIPMLIACAVSAQADTFSVGPLNFDEDGDAVCRVAPSPLASGDVEIPATVTYQGSERIVTAIADAAFAGCGNLTSILIPATVTEIGREAFMNCTALSGIEIPAGVSSIGRKTFYNCTALENVIIGAGVTTIDTQAFDRSPAITSMICYAENPPQTALYPFDTAIFPNITLTVPARHRPAYRAQYPWSEFSEIREEAIPGATVRLTLATPIGMAILTEPAGESVILRLTPDKGWKTSSVTLNGTDITSSIDSDSYLHTPRLEADARLEVVFVNAAGILSPAEANVRLSIVAERLIVTGTAPDDNLAVYDTAGNVIYSGRVATVFIPADGVYIVKTAGLTFKIRK